MIIYSPNLQNYLVQVYKNTELLNIHYKNCLYQNVGQREAIQVRGIEADKQFRTLISLEKGYFYK